MALMISKTEHRPTRPWRDLTCRLPVPDFEIHFPEPGPAHPPHGLVFSNCCTSSQKSNVHAFDSKPRRSIISFASFL